MHPAAAELPLQASRWCGCRRPTPLDAPAPFAPAVLPARRLLLVVSLLAAAAGVRFLVGFGLKTLRGEPHVGAACFYGTL